MTFTTRPTLQGTFGMVSSTHWLASQAAMGILERGGNAFDAAVTAGFVLHVVEPHLNGPGGEVPAIVATAQDPTPKVLCGQGPAPAGATIAHFRSLGMDLIPGAGPLAAAVPGAVDAWLLLLRDHGTLPLAEVLDPAIGYAASGHPLVARVGDTVAAVRKLFEEHWPTSAQLWLREGRPPAAGERFTNPAYAQTLRKLVEAAQSAGADREAQIEAARRAWREGFVAEAVDRFSRKPFQDSSGSPHAGLVTGADMAAYSATWEEPVTLDWHGHTVAKTGFWGQGPVLLQTLSILDALDDDSAYDPSTAAGIHAQAEALKLAFADREAWYGDGADVPAKALLSREYARERAALIGDRASTELRPGRPDGADPRLSSHVRRGAGPLVDTTDATTGEPTVKSDGVTRGDTCHVDVVDRWGNMISATPSGGWLQSSPTIPDLGFPLGSRLQMFWLEEGLSSSLAPGRRPRTTLSPTLVLRDGEPVMACGTPGGDQQDQWQLLFLLRHLVGGRSLQEAIDAPAWHTMSLPASFYPRGMEPGVLVVEDRLDEDTLATLRAYGHEVRLSDPWSLGRLCAVTRDPRTGLLAAGANPRGMQGYACGR
ncbi:gamma-glutamyltransferase family protein [Micromonospora avicenniae]|uniref:Gamma-glutamyltranspeptidase / glutathione hydrolase n=1 Tax=Micromonospora avicenniae TaxID=1198245 RepID=A0A1N7BLZ2_9ACTN|nr:gamma-glutamyltransferase family protein [Micromonospora avicenniae]SIR52286.1 gamma-glutamyltranspeptidase / glutathione hydrolase [Micromonospora avicenniae]